MTDIFNKIKGLRFSPFLLCFFCGLLYSLPYYNKSTFFASYISLTVFFTIIFNKDRRKKIFRYFYAFSFGFYFCLYLWLGELYPFNGFGFTPTQGKIIVVLACLGIPLYHALLHSTVMSLTKLLPDNKVLITIGFGAVWILSEWVMSVGALGFPWGRAALSQIGFLSSVQTVSLFGSYFIVLVLVCSSMLFAFYFKEKNKFFAISGALIILANSLVGVILKNIPAKTTGDGVKVAILQGNASMEDKWSGTTSTQKIWETYIDFASEAADNGAKIVVMPESAIPTDFSVIYPSLSSVASEKNITIVAGVLVNSSEGSFNSVIAIYPDGSVSERYDKRHIVPFGEYIPYRSFLGKLIPFIEELNLGDFTTIAGKEPKVIETEGMKSTSLVCFDSIFDSLSRDGINKGAEYITVVTNDSWFKESAGIEQHLGHSVLRAIENRRYIVRAANTGISAFISPEGEILKCTKPMTQDIIYDTVYPVNSRTLYSVTGNIVLYISGIFELVIIVMYIIKKSKNKGSKRNADKD